MKQYLDLLTKVLDEGVHKSDRTGTGTRSMFGYQMRFDLQAGFPLMTTKKVFTRGVFGELLWFLKGSTNIAWLTEHNIHIWDEWASPEAISDRSTATSGEAGRPRTVGTSIRSAQ